MGGSTVQCGNSAVIAILVLAVTVDRHERLDIVIESSRHWASPSASRLEY
jgi:hypothetical protein